MIVFDKTQTNEIKKDYSCDRITVTTENEQGYTHGVRRKGRGKKKGRSRKMRMYFEDRAD